MIVNYTDAGWEVITQRAHGLLAAQLAGFWKFPSLPDYWTETLLAIAEHDDAEVELDGERLISDTGGPLNFTMKPFDLKHCEKVSQLAITKSRYIALLTSRHMEFLYREAAGKVPAARAFLQRHTRLRLNWMKELGLSEYNVAKIYALFEWCDACSLLLCGDKLPPEQRKIDISMGPDKNVHRLSGDGENKLTIDPWPFSVDSFSINCDYRVIKQLKFSSSAEFRKRYLAAKTEVKIWNVASKL